jgi:Carboxypeptidase regulatory-like domain/TonB dependent receptor
MMNLKRWVLPLLLAFGSGACFAQSTNAGDIRGTVTDSSGAVLPGVTVTVLNVDTGVAKEYTTNQSGLYDTDSIVTGSYKITFTKDGFERLVRGPVTLQVGFTTVNGELKVGAISQEVTVTSDVALLQTETSEQSTTLESKSMALLPQVTQDWENFAILLPGATGTPNGSQGSSNPGQEVAVNGNLPYSNIIADGASTTLSHSQNANPAGFENVSELQVSTSSFSAQYGIGGIIFNQVSKSGTNRFHGTAYDFLQNDSLTAYPYGFGKSKTDLGPIPHLRYNNFGGAIGGPILKNKMFFYFNYDQIVNHGNSNGFESLPTDAMIGGNFTLPTMNTLFDPTKQTIAIDGKGNPYPVRPSFASEYGANIIPAALFDPVAAKFQQFYPTTASHIPGLTPVGNPTIGSEGEPTSNWHYSIQSSSPVHRYFGRLDYDLTQNHRITMSDTQADFTYPGPSTITACPVGCQSGDVDNNNAQVTEVWNISPRTVNEARIGYTAQLNYFADSSLNHGYAAQLGWQFNKADDIPAIQFTNGPYAWLQPGSNSVYKEHVFDFSDVVTMIRGKHILHFGGELLMYRDDSTAWGNIVAGNTQYNGAYTKQWTVDPAVCGNVGGAACTVPGTGFEYADFLLGYINSWNASISPEYGARLKSPQIFVQDDFKVRPNLTLNLGLRYQINHGWNEVTGNMATFDPTVINPATNTPGAFWFGETHANGRTSLEANVYNTFLPRVGFAWAARPNTTIRGGFGLYAYNWSLDTYGGGMGGSVSSSGSLSDNSNGLTPVALLGGNGHTITPITGGDSGTALPYTSASQDPTRFNGNNVSYTQYHTPVPKIYQWNLSAERQVMTNTMVQLAYVGSHGYNLNFPTDLNQVPANLRSSNDSGNRPYSNFGGISGSTNNGISNYNSFQASLTERMSRGLSFSFNYVWSHFLDDADSSGWGSRAGEQPFQVANNPAANYSNSNFDVRHAFKGYAVYQMPFGRGKQFLNGNTLVDEVVGGWQVSGTVVLQTGNPFTVYATQNTYALAGSAFPNWNPGVNWKPANQSIQNWYNPAAFLRPADGTFGNVRRNSLYGPGLNVFNFSAAKSFTVPYGEGIKVEFRADAQNVFNHPSFGDPSTGLGNTPGTGGTGLPYNNTTTISSVTEGGRNLQLALRVSF